MKELSFKLPIGLFVENNYTRDITLLKSNSIAEEVFTSKTPEKPHTWIANVISVATESIGGVPIGASVREHYLKTKNINIPKTVKDIALADANSLLLEIHRRVWQSIIPNQEIVCKFCAKKLPATIDLDRVEMTEKSKSILAGEPKFTALEVRLSDDDAIDFTSWIESLKDSNKDAELSYIKGVKFNSIIFRVPTIGDAMKHERIANKSIDFWRKISLDCITEIRRVSSDGSVTDAFPMDKFIWVSLDFFTLCSIEALREIRRCMREELPTYPFNYKDECPCDMRREIPYTMEASSFFSE